MEGLSRVWGSPRWNLRCSGLWHQGPSCFRMLGQGICRISGRFARCRPYPTPCPSAYISHGSLQQFDKEAERTSKRAGPSILHDLYNIIYICIYRSIYVSIYLSIYLPIYLSTYTYHVYSFTHFLLQRPLRCGPAAGSAPERASQSGFPGRAILMDS